MFILTRHATDGLSKPLDTVMETAIHKVIVLPSLTAAVEKKEVIEGRRAQGAPSKSALGCGIFYRHVAYSVPYVKYWVQ